MARIFLKTSIRRSLWEKKTEQGLGWPKHLSRWVYNNLPKPLTVWITINCGKFWKRWEYQTTWFASWETYMQVRKQVRTRHGTTDWFQIGKGVRQGCISSPCLFNLYAEYIMRNAGLEEAQAGMKIAGRNINNLRYADDTTLMAESEEELKSLWWKWKRRVKKLA